MNSSLPAGTSASRLVLRALSISKSYPGVTSRAGHVELFRDLTLEIAAGELVAIIGRSGVGKSSLLHLLAGLDRPSSGEVWIGDTALSTLSADQLARTRNRRIGYLWQFHHLLPEFTAEENAAMPLLAAGVRHGLAIKTARHWLDRVDLATRAKHRPGELSGGEQQRIAIARALVTGPLILFADEPTGDLDDDTAAQLFVLLQRLCREHDLAVILVTHSAGLAQRCDRVLRLGSGALQPVTPSQRA